MAITVLIGTLDTKGNEYEYARTCLRQAGSDVILIDTGVLGTPQIVPDIASNEVARAGGFVLERLRTGRSEDRAAAIEAMSGGLRRVLANLLKEGRCDAVFGMGGSGGSNIFSAAMQALPLGLPKLILSTMMAGDVRHYVGSCDLTMMYSVTDIAGLNRFSRLIISNAAHAAAGMAQGYAAAKAAATRSGRPLVAISMFGITTPGVLRLRERLEGSGFDTIVFHATGAGGMAMERMIAAGQIDGVIDYTLAELCDELFGGIFPSQESRLTAASLAKIPQIVVPGAIDTLNFGAAESVPVHLNVPRRKLIVHNPTVCAVKASHEEMAQLGAEVAKRLSLAKCCTEVLLPLGGLSVYSQNGGPWTDPEGDRILFNAIETGLSDAVPVRECPGNVNDEAFSNQVLAAFMRLWSQKS